MTEQEAIRNLILLRTFVPDLDKTLDMAIEALKRQIPKKPKITLQNGYCGNCGIAWGYERLIEEQRCGYKYLQFCPNCGHKIDWSDTE